MENSMKSFVLDFARDGEKLRVSAYEKVSDEEETLKRYEERMISAITVEKLCKETVTILNRSNKRGDISPEILNDLRKAGHSLYDELLTQKVKESLHSTSSETLILHLDDQLVHIPWELLFDGNDFLCLRFGMGRIVSTKRTVATLRRRERKASLHMLVLADPQGNLDSAYNEGIAVRQELGAYENSLKVNFVSTRISVDYLKKNIRDYDIVHYAGHAEYDPHEPSQSGWILSDGKWTSSDIVKLAGGAPLPFLVFSNACHSGRTEEWLIAENSEKQIYGLAHAFLLSGATHYVGTFWEVLDSPSSLFAKEFYKALAQGSPIGEAVRIARRRLIDSYGKVNIIWASYMLYGDPTISLVSKSSLSRPEDKYKLPEHNTACGEVGFEPKENEPRSADEKHAMKSKKTRNILIGLTAMLALFAIYFGIRELSTGPGRQHPVPELKQEMISEKTDALELSINIIGQREERDGSVYEVIVKEGSILHSYDNFQVHLTSNKDAYVYILLYDSKGQASQLFPDPKIQLSNRLFGGKEYSIPSNKQWFWLDENIGVETIYVLVSETPLDGIQNLLHRMSAITDQEKRELSKQVREEIRMVERGVGGITEDKAKTFNLKNGKTIQSVTDTVTGTGAIVRAVTFRHIDHRPIKLGSIAAKGKLIAQDANILIRSAQIVVKGVSGTESSKGGTMVAKRLKNLAKNSLLEETRAMGGSQVYKAVAPAVVLVGTEEGIGSGSVLDKSGHVLTNWHVVKGYERVVVFFKPEKSIEIKKENAYVARVIKVDEMTDLALLKIERPSAKLPVAKLGVMRDVEIAQEVHAIGHPEGEVWTYTKGIISQIRPSYEWTYDNKIIHKSKVIQTQTPINPGNSGGPLLNDKAEIIGINSFVKRGDGLNFAVSVDVIKDFLDRKESRLVERPLPQKATGDVLKNAQYYEADLNKDGIVDVVCIDSDGNGKADVFIVDQNQDGEIDYIGIDKDENGKIELYMYDLDKNNKIDVWAFDADENGIIELYAFDYDEDGNVDEYVKE